MKLGFSSFTNFKWVVTPLGRSSRSHWSVFQSDIAERSPSVEHKTCRLPSREHRKYFQSSREELHERSSACLLKHYTTLIVLWFYYFFGRRLHGAKRTHKKIRKFFLLCEKGTERRFCFHFFLFKFMQKSLPLAFWGLKKESSNDDDDTKKGKSEREGEQSDPSATLGWLKRFRNEIIGIIECTQTRRVGVSSQMMLE